jgi:hypothetical protein
MSDDRNYDNAYKSYLDQAVWKKQSGSGRWEHDTGAALNVFGNRPVNRWELTVGSDTYSGEGVHDLDARLGQLNLRGAGGRRNPC